MRLAFMDESKFQRLIFVELMPRENILAFLSLCKVMLGTFPWGEGVTTFEAFSVKVPVVILPSKVTVEQLTLGQIRVLGLEDELVGNSIDDYIDKAVRIGTDKIWRDGIVKVICSKVSELFGEEALRRVVNEWESFLLRASGGIA